MDNQRGGSRPGAGRKPLPDSDKSVAVTVRLPPEMADYLKANGPTQTIRSLIERSRAYRQRGKD